MSRKRGGGRPHNGPPGGHAWVWLTEEMLTSLGFRALGVHALRILHRLLVEHMRHAGSENGRLGVSHRQFADWGVSRDDVRKGLEELEAAGFADRVTTGLYLTGGQGTPPSTFALTFLPTGMWPGGQPEHASDRWRLVDRQLRDAGIVEVAAARRWLRDQVEHVARSTPTAVGETQGEAPRMWPPKPPGCGQKAA